jgi:hypothetical protein
MAKTAPVPVFRLFAQSALDGIPMNVAELFDELPMISDIEIAMAFLPEVVGFADQPSGNFLVEGFDGVGQRSR